MKPITVRQLHGKGTILPTSDEHLPTASKGFEWRESGTINWRYLDLRDAPGDAELWCVRGGDGTLCIGVMNHHGYEIERGDDLNTVVTQVLAMHRLGLCKRS